MKKIWILCFLCTFLGACSGVSIRPSCDGRDLQKPSYFAHGEKLAAFRLLATARGYGMEGILQVKKIAEDSFDVTLFAVAGGYLLMQAVVTKEGAAFSYIPKEADSAIARAKAETFLKILLFPPMGASKCREKENVRIVTYKDGGTLRYEYEGAQSYPQSLAYKKTFGSAHLNFAQYAPYEAGELPHLLYYEDGAVEAELILLSIKK